MADGWDPEGLGEPGQRPAPRLSPSPLLLPSLSLSLIQRRLLWSRIDSLNSCVQRENKAARGGRV